MRSDSEIKRDVEDELRWDPDIDPTDIAVAVKNGVVTLTGYVRSYAEKFAAEQFDPPAAAGRAEAGSRSSRRLRKHSDAAHRFRAGRIGRSATNRGSAAPRPIPLRSPRP